MNPLELAFLIVAVVALILALAGPAESRVIGVAVLFVLAVLAILRVLPR